MGGDCVCGGERGGVTSLLGQDKGASGLDQWEGEEGAGPEGVTANRKKRRVFLLVFLCVSVCVCLCVCLFELGTEVIDVV